MGRQSLAPVSKRRRRSSARFLRNRLSVSSVATPAPSEQHLGELYLKAIRMNAENRINAQNSWNLPLIEHIDKFLEEEEQEEEETAFGKQQQQPAEQAKTSKRVNFTKASCTLDASVKIYSFRVDDVHLTSYKVLANLNRNQKNDQPERDDVEVGDEDGDGDEPSSKTPARKASRSVQTLETNLANINISRLDSAFDIDPLFHKMSKTFDEGGAKGLLLANLQTNNGSIVFDSTEQQEDNTFHDRLQPESVDISSLQQKLESVFAEQPLEDMQLVPQLASLRAEHATLETQGFVVTDQLPKSKRFLPTEDEEELADKSIHQDALERSTRTPAKSIIRDDDDDDSSMYRGSPPAFNITPQGEFAAEQYGSDDFGGGDDDDDDDFINFLAQENTNSHRYSGASFAAGSAIGSNDPFTDQGPSPTAMLLDAIANTDLLSQSDYTFLNQRALSQVENLWAGATHWKPLRKNMGKRAKDPEIIAARKKAPRKKVIKERVFVCFVETPDMSDILKKPPKMKKGGDPLKMSSAVVSKHAKNLNLLPLDAGIGVEQLSKLFLRPNAVLSSVTTGAGNATSGPSKTVAFDMTGFNTWGDDDGGNDDDDDGPGFVMNNDDDYENDSVDENQDFCIRELEDIRKVEKVRVGYATVAKKVDVKRLKRDLWKELEERFADGGSPEEEDMDEDEEKMNEAVAGVSFQKAVQDLEQSKSQADATLSFYFISVLHLANEKGLRLESKGLGDFEIYQDASVAGATSW
jgi:condensin complex subunit 2